MTIWIHGAKLLTKFWKNRSNDTRDRTSVNTLSMQRQHSLMNAAFYLINLWTHKSITVNIFRPQNGLFSNSVAQRRSGNDNLFCLRPGKQKNQKPFLNRGLARTTSRRPAWMLTISFFVCGLLRVSAVSTSFFLWFWNVKGLNRSGITGVIFTSTCKTAAGCRGQCCGGRSLWYLRLTAPACFYLAADQEPQPHRPPAEV